MTHHTDATTRLRPYPVADDVTREFWDAVAQRRLAVQFCASCQRYVHPPRPSCPYCNHDDLAFRQVSGAGRIWSWTVTRRPAVQGFAEDPPYLIALVELVEQDGLLMVTDMPYADKDRVAVGAPVRVRFDAVNGAKGAFLLPRFLLSEDV